MTGLRPQPPSIADANWDDPSDHEVRAVSGALVDALGGPERINPIQLVTVAAITRSMTGRSFELDELPDIGPTGLAEAMADRAEPWRRRILHVMMIGALLLEEIPAEIHDRLEEYAAALGITDDMLDVTEQLAIGSRAAALADFQRSGYEGAWTAESTAGTGVSTLESAWEIVEDDPALAARWTALGDCPHRSLGRGVYDFYRARGFAFPGQPGSAPPLLAQHDWVHVLADYGSTVASEIEVFSFISMANEDARAFSLQAMVLSLFESGHLATGAGLFEADTGHFSADGQAMAVRMGDAMRRGFLCGTRAGGDDLLSVDWFSLADQPLEDLRRRFHIVPKSQEAWEAGSVTAWERGGISPFQYEQGLAAAEAAGDGHEPHGASPGYPGGANGRNPAPEA
ncbi:MAG: hypothetical protein AAGA65_15360 [Actinomycetota bacterium]